MTKLIDLIEASQIQKAIALLDSPNHGIDLDAKDAESGRTALHCAVLTVDEKLVNKLIEKGADKDIIDFISGSPLHLAAGCGYAQIVKILIEKGADIECTNKSEETPLHTAASSGHLQVVQMLLNQGANINCKNKAGETPLHTAADKDKAQVVEILLSQGAEINHKNNAGWAPLHSAAYSGHRTFIEMSINYSANKKGKDRNDYLPLNSAAYQGNVKIVEILLDHDADVECKANDGETPLHLAACTGHSHIVEKLLNKGAKINSKANNGRSPLHDAVWLGQAQVAEKLIQHGAEINCKANDGWTPLHLAASRGNTQIVEMLLNQGAEINCKANNDLTPLHLAAEQGNTQVVAMLLKKGAEIDCKSCFNQTPLHDAAFWNHSQVVEMLLDKGADITVKNKSQETAVDIARQRKHQAIVKLLEAAEKKQAQQLNLSTTNPIPSNQSKREEELVTDNAQPVDPIKIPVNNKRKPETQLIDLIETNQIKEATALLDKPKQRIDLDVADIPRLQQEVMANSTTNQPELEAEPKTVKESAHHRPSFFTRLKDNMTWPSFSTLLKWLIIGAVIANALYWSGGLAAIPFLTPYVVKLGIASIYIAAPVLGIAAATLWHGVIKPLGFGLSKLYQALKDRANTAKVEEPLLSHTSEPLDNKVSAIQSSATVAAQPIIPGTTTGTEFFPEEAEKLDKGTDRTKTINKETPRAS